MDGRGVRLLVRELELPETAVTVRVRDGERFMTASCPVPAGGQRR
jgi:hypothetical protein